MNSELPYFIHLKYLIALKPLSRTFRAKPLYIGRPKNAIVRMFGRFYWQPMCLHPGVRRKAFRFFEGRCTLPCVTLLPLYPDILISLSSEIDDDLDDGAHGDVKLVIFMHDILSTSPGKIVTSRHPSRQDVTAVNSG